MGFTKSLAAQLKDAARDHLDNMEWSSALSLYSQALSIFSHIGEAQEALECHLKLGFIGLSTSHFKLAQENFVAALISCAEMGDIRGRADCLKRLGNVMFCRGELNASVDHFMAAQPLYEKLGVTEREAACWRSIADVAILRGDADEASKHFAHAKLLFSQAHSPIGVASCVSGEGEVALLRQQPRIATEKLVAVLQVYEQFNVGWGSAFVTRKLGWAVLSSGTESNDFIKAKEHFENALQLSESCGNDLERAHCLRDLGKLAERTGDWAEMEARLCEAAEIYAKCDVFSERSAALNLIKRMQATECSFPDRQTVKILISLAGDSKTDSCTPDSDKAVCHPSLMQLYVRCIAQRLLHLPDGPAHLFLYENNHDKKIHMALVIDSSLLKEASGALVMPRIQSKSLNAIRSKTETTCNKVARRASILQPTQLCNELEEYTKESLLPLVRVHSSCFTGETLLSQRCECRESMMEAIRIISSNPCTSISKAGINKHEQPPLGVLVYMSQEGRGIGLLSKLRGFNLQDMGMDDRAAAMALGHREDERTYEQAAAILCDLGLGGETGLGVRLMTANQAKATDLRNGGIHIEEIYPF